jgi:hypothetical protein
LPINGSCYRDVIWNATSNGPYIITATAIDNTNAKTSISYNISACPTNCSGPNPDLQEQSGSPSNLLTDKFLRGNNGFMRFSISFKSSIKRPTTPAFIKIYTSSGVNYMNLDCQSSGYVYYVGNTMYLDIMVNTFTAQSYYILFDEGVGTVDSSCKSKSTTINDQTFWTFTVTDSYKISLTTKYLINNLNLNCLSLIISNSNQSTKCNVSSMILSLFLLYLICLIINLILIEIMRRCIKRRLIRVNQVVQESMFFKLHIPSSYKLELK